MSPSSSSIDISVVVASCPSARAGHLQVLHHLRQLIEQLPRGVPIAGLGKLLHAIEHAFEV